MHTHTCTNKLRFLHVSWHTLQKLFDNFYATVELKTFFFIKQQVARRQRLLHWQHSRYTVDEHMWCWCWHSTNDCVAQQFCPKRNGCLTFKLAHRIGLSRLKTKSKKIKEELIHPLWKCIIEIYELSHSHSQLQTCTDTSFGMEKFLSTTIVPSSNFFY